MLTDLFSFCLSFCLPLSLFNTVCSLAFKLQSCGVWAAVCSSGWRGFSPYQFSLYLPSAALPYSLPGLLFVSLIVFFFFAVLFLSEWPDSYCAHTDPWNGLYLCSPGTKRHLSSGICLRYDREGFELYIILHATTADNMAQIWSPLLVYLSAAAFWTSWRVFRGLLQQPDNI